MEKRKTRNNRRLTEEELIQLTKLAGYGLRQKEIAHFFDICEDLLQSHYREAWEAGKAIAISLVAQRCYERALENDIMTMFYLKTQGKWRETEKDEAPELEELEAPVKLLRYKVDNTPRRDRH